MATSRVSSNLSTVVSVLHLIFTILAIAILSYKVYYLEGELSLIRHPGSSNGISVPIQTPPPLTTAVTSEQHETVRIRRVSQRKPSKSPSADDLQAECVQKMLNNLRVCVGFYAIYVAFLSEKSNSHDSRQILSLVVMLQ